LTAFKFCFQKKYLHRYIEDAKDELYAIYDVVAERTALVAEAEAVGPGRY
jgi:hypothetical protein